MKDKSILYCFIFTFLLFILQSSNSAAQGPDYTTWDLPEGAIARLGKGTVRDIDYSPDGQVFAVASSVGIWLYDAHTYTEIALLTGRNEYVSAVAFSSDGNILASGGGGRSTFDNGIVQLWDVTQRREIATLSGHSDRVESVVFSPEGHTLASADSETTLCLSTSVGTVSKGASIVLSPTTRGKIINKTFSQILSSQLLN